MVVHSSGRAPPQLHPVPGAGPYSGGCKGKGKGKIKGKGGKYQGGKGGPAADSSLARYTPDGRPICFAWNNPKERCRGQCNRAHVCRKCFGNHPYHHCGGKEAAKPPQGSK